MAEIRRQAALKMDELAQLRLKYGWDDLPRAVESTPTAPQLRREAQTPAERRPPRPAPTSVTYGVDDGGHDSLPAVEVLAGCAIVTSWVLVMLHFAGVL